MSQTTSNLLYLVTIVCFVLALRFLSSPTTARRGNWVGAFGMAWAIGVTLALPEVHLNWRIIVGALLVAGTADPDLLTGWVGFIAMILASANVVGGFVVTDRMLEMFKRREPPKEKDDSANQ